MQEWSDEFVTQAQHELTSMVTDWKYDYGVSDRDCSAMLLWMLIKLNPALFRVVPLVLFSAPR